MTGQQVNDPVHRDGAVFRVSHRDLPVGGSQVLEEDPVHLAQRHERPDGVGPFSRDSRATQVSWSNRCAT